MKVAILISGLVRTWNQSFKTLKEEIIDKNPNICFDFYLTPWDHTHCRNKHRSDYNTTKFEVTEDTFENIKKLYNPKYFDVLSYDEAKNNIKTDPIVQETHGIIKSRIPSYGDEFLWNSMFMAHYGMYLNYQRFLKHSDDEKYDLILKGRFDLAYGNIFENPIDHNVLNVCEPQFALGFNNFLALSKPEIMREYFCSYEKLKCKDFITKFPVRFPECFLRILFEDKLIPIHHVLHESSIIRE